MNIPDNILGQLSGFTPNGFVPPRQFIKSVSFQPGSTAAGANNNITVPTFDDNKIRTVLGFWASVATPGMRFQLTSSGRIFVDSDYSLFSATYGPQPAFAPYQENVPLIVNLLNSSAGTVAAHFATLIYAVYDPTFVL